MLNFLIVAVPVLWIAALALNICIAWKRRWGVWPWEDNTNGY